LLSETAAFIDGPFLIDKVAADARVSMVDALKFSSSMRSAAMCDRIALRSRIARVRGSIAAQNAAEDFEIRGGRRAHARRSYR
jgi:hypothetical protein